MRPALPAWKNPPLIRRRERAEVRAALLHIAKSPKTWRVIGVLVLGAALFSAASQGAVVSLAVAMGA
ncbi:hypothetical protein [Roseomonas xinghualingensis]|uniref:hypothetical protein n=1 Tax=Roseomonas xinghualingensis TaxID=2986475 RepID=UPI0021F1FEA2|nr:hypothetical protein [Roseomonas sp. SXEYE001]MCV4208579.1 hypothetical protein [Roseomonas sp. SXEYE001]